MSSDNSHHRNQAIRTARAALNLLTERGLPPTPEHYANVYREVSGEALNIVPPQQAGGLTAEQKLDSNRELLKLIHTLVSSVTERTGELAGSLDLQNRSMRDSIDALNQTEEKNEIIALLQFVSATAQSIQQSVEETHHELVSTQAALETMRSELQVTREQMMLDPLTGTRNRFSMDITLNQEIARVRRNNGNFTVALLDLDYFKNINDTYGHDAGDQLLVYYAQLFKAVLRETDILFRYGGEEFLLVLPDTELQGAIFMLERLKQMLKKSPLHYQNHKIIATFSAGVAELLPGETSSELLNRADRALYAAKAGGRNLILTADTAAS